MKKISLLLVLLVIFSGCIQIEDGPGLIACTQDAKLCPDGSYVSRVPPTCDFAPCPEVEEPETKTINIEIANYQIYPKTVTVEKGTTVIWTNNDTRTHSLGSAKIGSSGTLQPGESWNHTFDEEGTFKYYCTFHFEKGTIIVT